MNGSSTVASRAGGDDAALSTDAVDAYALSRRELQFLVKELQLCRANDKTHVLQERLATFLDAQPSRHGVVQALLTDMPEEMRFQTPGTQTPSMQTPQSRKLHANNANSSTSVRKIQQRLDFEAGCSSTPLRRSSRKASKYASMALSGATTTELAIAKSLEDEWQVARNITFDSSNSTEEAMDLPVPESPTRTPDHENCHKCSPKLVRQHEPICKQKEHGKVVKERQEETKQQRGLESREQPSKSPQSQEPKRQKLKHAVNSSTPRCRSARKAAKYASLALSGATTIELAIAKSLEDQHPVTRNITFGSSESTEEAGCVLVIDLSGPTSDQPPHHKDLAKRHKQREALQRANEQQELMEEALQTQQKPEQPEQQDRAERQGGSPARELQAKLQQEMVHHEEPEHEPEDEPEATESDTQTSTKDSCVTSLSFDSCATPPQDETEGSGSDKDLHEKNANSDEAGPARSFAQVDSSFVLSSNESAREPLGHITNTIHYLHQKQKRQSPPHTNTGKSTTPSSSASSHALNGHRPREEDSEVNHLVRTHDDLSFLPAPNDRRVICRLTGHEMKADKQVILSHINGKKYQRLKAQQNSFEQFAPMFVAHPDPVKRKTMLWCYVTESSVPRELARVHAHIAGNRYKRALPEWKASFDQEHSKLNGLLTPTGKRLRFTTPKSSGC